MLKYKIPQIVTLTRFLHVWGKWGQRIFRVGKLSFKRIA